MYNIADISTALNILLNQPLFDVGYAGDMLWLGVGNPIQYVDYRGRSKMISEFALHLQCPWRFVLNQKIVLASHDFYLPKSPQSVPTSSVFEEKYTAFRALVTSEKFSIKDIKTDSLGGFTLYFHKDLIFEVFIHSSEPIECWRLINSTTNEHFVLFDSF